MIKKMICHKEKTLFDALWAINNNAKGIVFIVDSKNRLSGVLSDGDIRRLLLSGHNLQEKISGVIKNKFAFVKAGDSYEKMLSKITYRIKILPIVDSNFRVLDFFEYRDEVHIPITTPDLKTKEFKYLIDAFLSTWISSSGKYVKEFEEKFSNFCGCRYGVATSSGTSALHLALLALGIGKGDSVIVPDLTFAATINTVLYTNATPIIVDIERDSWCIDPKEIEKAITPRTKAIIVVHLYGQPANIESITAIAKKHNLYVVEDCAQAHGAKFNGKKVGSFGNIGCFSFYGNKIVTTGEGGMCVTDSKELNQKMAILRDHGMSRENKYWHEVVGYNYRLTNIQAAIGVAQLERINKIISARERIEERYKRHLAGIEFIEFQNGSLQKRKKVTWLVSILVKNNKKNKYLDEFKKRGIDARPFFHPLSFMPIYKKYIFSNKVSSEISQKGINLPTHLKLESHTFDSIKKVFI